MRDKKIGENDKAIFYENFFTRDYRDGYRSIVAEQKDTNEMEYLLLKNNKPVYANTSIEAINIQHNLLVKLDNDKGNSYIKAAEALKQLGEIGAEINFSEDRNEVNINFKFKHDNEVLMPKLQEAEHKRK